MVNIHIHQFEPGGAVVDAEALGVFPAQWSIYQKRVDSDVLSHAAGMLGRAARRPMPVCSGRRCRWMIALPGSAPASA